MKNKKLGDSNGIKFILFNGMPDENIYLSEFNKKETINVLRNTADLIESGRIKIKKFEN